MKLAQVCSKQKLENWNVIKFVECGNLNVGIPDRSDMRNNSAEILSVPVPILNKTGFYFF